MRSDISSPNRRSIQPAGWDLRTTVLVLSLSLSFILLLVTNAVFPPLTFAVLIIIVIIILVYASSVVMARFRGYLVDPITECLFMMGPTVGVFIVLALRPSAFPAWLSYLSLPALLLGTTIAVSPLVKVRRRPLSVTIRSLALIFLGILLFILLIQTGQGAWGQVLLFSLALASAINLLGLFREHSNPLLRDMGRAIDRRAGTILIVLALVLTSAYVIIWRASVFESNMAVVGAAEWMLVALVVLAFAVMIILRLRGYQAESSDLEQQELEVITSNPALASSDLTVATQAVRAFVEGGDNKRVIVLLIGALKNNGLNDGEIAEVVGEVIRYEEEEVALASAWMYGDIKAQRRKERIALLRRVLNTASIRSRKEARGTVGRRPL